MSDFHGMGCHHDRALTDESLQKLRDRVTVAMQPEAENADSTGKLKLPTVKEDLQANKKV